METGKASHPPQRAGAAIAAAAIALVAALVAGCSTSGFSRGLKERYIGTSADSFFSRHGGPVSSVGYGKEARIHLWFSGRSSAYAPGDKGTVDLIGNTAWWRGYTVPHYSPLNECRLQIYVGADGYIYDIRIFGGERDLQHVHRCREVFWWNL